MRYSIGFTVVVMLVTAGIVSAAPSGKILEFTKSPMGVVKFSGTVHKEAGVKCNECHNKGMFPAYKQGTVAITMEQIYAGKLCGVCHNGGRAFDAKANCNRCHVKQ